MAKDKANPERDALLVCDCQRSMKIDGAELSRMLDGDAPVVIHRELCRSGIAAFEAALPGGTVHVACTQEAPLFKELATEQGRDENALRFTNIRERAGWSDAGRAAMPKMAALLAEGAYHAEPAPLLSLKSAGLCLVYGRGQSALDVASKLGTRLDVTVLLTDAEDAIPPSVVKQSIACGRIRTVSGHLGAFEMVIDGYAPVLPASRTKLDFAMARDGAKTRCDLILDVSGNAPLFSALHPRDGYIAANPQDAAAVANALFEISDLVGEFEKPKYVGYEASICAHGRNGKVGCTNCLDTCPVGAIKPDGDAVAIDHAICGGCGSCSAVCPTSAVSYAFPQRKDLYGRARVLLETYRNAGGAHPIVLFHDGTHGSEMIDAMARFGRGLPPNVLPLSVYSVQQLGHDLISAMFALGAEQIVILAPPRFAAELAPLEFEVALADTFLEQLGYGGSRVRVVVERDPDILEALLHDLPPLSDIHQSVFIGISNKRELARTSLAALNQHAPQPQRLIALPKGAPYGRIQIETSGCTLCLSCVGACPTGALADNAERPEVRFTEAACVQCGLCAATCPEKVITLEPRYDFTTACLDQQTLHFEEPFHCIRCQKPFGTRSSIERVVKRLEGHSMFQGADKLALIQMCDTCRIEALSESHDDPFRGPDRPRIRTTDDYVAAREAATRTGTKPEDFLD